MRVIRDLSALVDDVLDFFVSGCSLLDSNIDLSEDLVDLCGFGGVDAGLDLLGGGGLVRLAGSLRGLTVLDDGREVFNNGECVLHHPHGLDH